MPPETSTATIDVDVLAEPPRVRVVGEIDEPVARGLRTTLIGLLSMGYAEVDVDLGQVHRVDPSVRQVFSDVWSRGLVLHLRNPSPEVQELLHLEAT